MNKSIDAIQRMTTDMGRIGVSLKQMTENIGRVREALPSFYDALGVMLAAHLRDQRKINCENGPGSPPSNPSPSP